MAELCINNKHFNIEHLVKIADVLDMKVEEFFEGVMCNDSTKIEF